MALAGPRPERIRPCLHCGALMTFSALRCGSCGTPVSGAPPPDERVRPCLQCGVILRFDQDPCPQCGARARPDGETEDRVKPCAGCGELVAFDQLYCGKCGELSIPIETDQIPPVLELNEPGTPLAQLPLLLAGLCLAGGAVAL